ncbi:glycosyltransferase family 2 protein [Rhodobacteraceae bacterium 10Alg 79]|uniref:Glycosyltransferase family 2 protein n=2 Tax=Rhodalgimonas zhirmunskyi TaxID=2964767 RepID=A0AAJ1UBC5_9RHOB|nr:glycosyltransferase family 2 protein [Rhodoalgimonas zhirmunskyi]
MEQTKIPTWGIVTTARATPRDIARFVAHHLGLGAARIDIYLDGQDPPPLAHPRLRFHAGAKAAHLHHRQMANAAHCYGDTTLDWLAHIDLDEFLLPEQPLAKQLAQLPENIAQAKLMPVEALAPLTGPVRHFKRPSAQAGQPRAVLETLYPDYGLHLRSGLISHSEGKAIFRTRLPLKPGVHRFRQNAPAARLPLTPLAHIHAPSWQAFQAALPARLKSGSYAAARPGQISIQTLLETLQDTGGEPAVKAFFQTVSTASPDHLAALDALGMLLTQDLQLDAKAQTLFPDLPQE